MPKNNASYIIEMHCHTVFSPDGRGTPEELVDLAASRGVMLLSITDHNHLGAQQRAAKRALELRLPYVTGVEIDAFVPQLGSNCHFVCYGYDVEDAKLNVLVERIAARYERSFMEVFPHLAEFGCPVELDELDELKAGLSQRYPTHPAPPLNQWFAKEWLCRQGKVDDVATYNNIAGKIRQKIENSGRTTPVDLVSFDEMRDAVHEAGGVVLMAHVGRYLPNDVLAQIDILHDLLKKGMDGFELYHPDNIKQTDFPVLENEAKRLDCLISGGSDCHDAMHIQNFATISADSSLMARFPRASRFAEHTRLM